MRTIFFILLILLISCNQKEKIDVDAKNFDQFSFNTKIIQDGNYGIGYYFYINNIKYYEKTDSSFVFFPRNFKEQKLLMPNTLTFNRYSVFWRNVQTPFKIIKKAKSDTLIIIKDNKKFIFLRKSNS